MTKFNLPPNCRATIIKDDPPPRLTGGKTPMNRIPKDRDTRLVTVCAECLQASCWHGEFMCDRSQNADTLDVPVYELQRMKREHPSHFSVENIAKVTGETPPNPTSLTDEDISTIRNALRLAILTSKGRVAAEFEPSVRLAAEAELEQYTRLRNLLTCSESAPPDDLQEPTSARRPVMIHATRRESGIPVLDESAPPDVETKPVSTRPPLPPVIATFTAPVVSIEDRRNPWPVQIASPEQMRDFTDEELVRHVAFVRSKGRVVRHDVFGVGAPPESSLTDEVEHPTLVRLDDALTVLDAILTEGVFDKRAIIQRMDKRVPKQPDAPPESFSEAQLEKVDRTIQDAFRGWKISGRLHDADLSGYTTDIISRLRGGCDSR